MKERMTDEGIVAAAKGEREGRREGWKGRGREREGGNVDTVIESHDTRISGHITQDQGLPAGYDYTKIRR